MTLTQNNRTRRRYWIVPDSRSHIQPEHQPWQVLLICWGTKYDHIDIDDIINRVKHQAFNCRQFILLSDRNFILKNDVIQIPIPPFYLRNEWKGPGCQAKLCMFEPDLLPTDLPTIYVDLDTLVLGDLGRALSRTRSKKSIQMLQGAVFPFSRAARFVSRLSKRRYHARGNSSVVVFHPKECGYISNTFKTYANDVLSGSFRPGMADDRFISWCAQDHLRALPNSFAVKFPTEFMLRTQFLTKLKSRLPWVERRRRALCAVTLTGALVKADDLLNLSEGETMKDKRGRWLIWTDEAIGYTRARLIDYAQSLRSKRQPPQ